MIKSMTGFGRCRTVLHGREISVEIKSVNHRFFEFSCRTPKGYGFLDDKLKALVNSRVSRGKIDMFVTVGTAEDTPAEVKINHSLVSGYINAMKEISETYGIEMMLRLRLSLVFPMYIRFQKHLKMKKKLQRMYLRQQIRLLTDLLQCVRLRAKNESRYSWQSGSYTCYR